MAAENQDLLITRNLYQAIVGMSLQLYNISPAPMTCMEPSFIFDNRTLSDKIIPRRFATF